MSHCNVCDKAFPKQGALIGMSIEIKTPLTQDPFELEIAAEQLYPYSLDTKYKICFPCRLKSLGVKP